MIIIYVLLCFVCVGLTGLVLIQDSKSGGLGGITGSSTMASLGANTDKTIVKITAVFAFLFFALILMTHFLDDSGKKYETLMGDAKQETIEKAPVAKEDALKKDAPADKADAPKEGTSVVVPIPATETPKKDELKEAPKTAEKTDASKTTDAAKDTVEPKKTDDAK